MHEFGRNLVFRDAYFQIESCLFYHMSIIGNGNSYQAMIGCSITPLGFLGSGHSVDSVLAMCAHLFDIHMHSMPKSIIFVNLNSIEDNAFMWLPLAFQV